MDKLTAGQGRILSDFLNYIAVAWFTGGVVTPILTKPETFLQAIKIPIEGTIMSIIFLVLSLLLTQETKL